MDDIVKRLDIKAGVMEMGERIAWGSDTALMREAARCIVALEVEVAGLESVIAVLREDIAYYKQLATDL